MSGVEPETGTASQSEQGEGPRLAEVPNGGWDARLRVFRAGDEVDTCALITQRYVVLVDTMATPELAEDIVAAVRGELAGRQLLVVNTHADWDHSWGNAAFEAPGGRYPEPIIGHARCAERLRGEEERRRLEEMRRKEARFTSVRLVPPTITFAGEGLRIDGGDLTLELLPTPGHTPDHVSVWVPELRLLLAGDAAEHPFPCVGPAEALPELRHSLERLRALDAAVVIPCHGGTTDPGLMERNLAYFAELERRAREALAEGRLPEGWEAREDLPDLLGLPYEAAVRMAGADPAKVPEGYRAFHVEAARAMVRWVSAK